MQRIALELGTDQWLQQCLLAAGVLFEIVQHGIPDTMLLASRLLLSCLPLAGLPQSQLLAQWT